MTNPSVSTTTAADNYDEITVLEGLEGVRKRPAFYLGGPTDINGLHTMIREIVDNGVDEAMAGVANRIDITIHRDGSVTISDNGRGIPVSINAKHQVSNLQLAATKLHGGGKFDSSNYKISSGLHGVGLSVVNALSEWLRIEVRRDGKLWRQEYRSGVPVAPVHEIGKAEGTGTTVSFLPDVTFFKEGLDYNFRALAQRFREMAYLTKGLRFCFVDERDDSEVNFYFEGGIGSFVRHLTKDRNVLHKTPFYIERTVEGINVELAFQYTEAYDTDSIYVFTNNVANPDGGTHLTGFRTALTRVINNYARNKSLLKENEANLTGDDVREGLTAVVSVKMADPQYNNQAKEKLVSPEAASAVSAVFSDAFSTWLDENPGEGKRIVEKCIAAARTRLAVQKVRETARKSAMDGFSLPGKLADCSDTNPARCELYIVEGDSAGGCFSGDTQVALADGRALSFKEIIAEQAEGKEHFCYTIRKDGSLGIERITNPRITKKNVEVVQVTLDNGETITCTPDHRFMLRDGSYKMAIDLTSNDSLMPLYRKYSDKRESGITIDGYEMAWDPRSQSWLFTHILADWYNRWNGVYAETDGDHCHHVDFNKHNNNPTNIRRLPSDIHLALHREHVGRTLHRPNVVKQGRKLRQSPEFRASMSQRMRQLDQTYYRKTVCALKQYERDGMIDLIAYQEHRKQTGDTSLLRFDSFCQRYFNGDETQAHEAVLNYNHRVVTVERLEERIDVYDLEVPHTHNFALACGVFVHNSAKQGRDRRFQAILPLRGKILNVEKSRLDKMLSNNEVRALITAIGASVGDQFDVSKLRYHRVILMSDADVDGSHIRTLLLTFFFRYMRPIIVNGHLYIAQPPLYRIKVGNEIVYVYSDRERDDYLAKLTKEQREKAYIQRYKGLGEMNAEQLWETTMNPANRIVLQVTLEDAQQADETFTMLMGDLVPPRKRFIQTHALEVKNLDI